MWQYQARLIAPYFGIREVTEDVINLIVRLINGSNEINFRLILLEAELPGVLCIIFSVIVPTKFTHPFRELHF